METTTEKHLAGSKFDHDQSTHGARGSYSLSHLRRRYEKAVRERGESDSLTRGYYSDWKHAEARRYGPTKAPAATRYNDGTPAAERQKKAIAWSTSLTQDERFAIREWGSWGGEIRKLQRGESVDHPKFQKYREDWESALDKGVQYEGPVYRGLSDVPLSELTSWIKSGGIELKNDQSATKGKDVADTFTGGARGVKAMWFIQQRSGVDLFGTTDVTQGGRSVNEREIILRKGTRYRVVGVRFVLASGEVFDSAAFFRGTNYSWPENPPPLSEFKGPHEFRKGHYEFALIEV